MAIESWLSACQYHFRAAGGTGGCGLGAVVMAERSGAQPGAAAKARIGPAVIGLAPAGPGARTITGAEGNQLAAGRLALVLR